jgi:beta-glucuronidase
MSRHFEAFDKLRTQGFFVGEMIWNFADFKTAQSKYRQSTAQCGQFSHQ